MCCLMFELLLIWIDWRWNDTHPIIWKLTSIDPLDFDTKTWIRIDSLFLFPSSSKQNWCHDGGSSYKVFHQILHETWLQPIRDKAYNSCVQCNGVDMEILRSLTTNISFKLQQIPHHFHAQILIWKTPPNLCQLFVSFRTERSQPAESLFWLKDKMCKCPVFSNFCCCCPLKVIFNNLTISINISMIINLTIAINLKISILN